MLRLDSLSNTASSNLFRPCCLLFPLLVMCSCNSSSASTEEESDVDAILSIQNAVIAEVDTFFYAFSDSSISAEEHYGKLASLLPASLQELKELHVSNRQQALRQASISVCMTVAELHNSSFREMLDLDSALIISFNEEEQQRFDSISQTSFDAIDAVQERFEQILNP